MPKLSHKCTIREDGTVDLSESELIKWAVTNTDILNYIGHRAMSSPYTRFDKETGLWEGTDSHLSVEEARQLTDVELYEREAKKNIRTRDGQKILDDTFEAIKKFDEDAGRHFATLLDLAIEMGVVERTVRRRATQSPFYYVWDGKVYEKMNLE